MEKVLTKPKEQPIKFDVRLASGSIVRCEYTGFAPVRDYDIVQLYCDFDKRRNVYVPFQPPRIETPEAREAIIRSMLKALYPHLTIQQAQKIYEKFKGCIKVDPATLQEARDRYADAEVEATEDQVIAKAAESKVVKFIDNLAIQFRQAQKVGPEQVARLGLEFEPELRQAQYRKLMSWWYINTIKRRLWALGFTDKNIYDCEFFYQDLNELYQEAIVNPFKIPPLPEDTCIDICVRRGLFELMDDPAVMYKSKILRKLYHNLVNRKWTCTPDKFLLEEFKEFDLHVAEMIESWNVDMDLGCTYLSKIREIEQTVTEYVRRPNFGPYVEHEDLRPGDDLCAQLFFKDPKLTEEQKSAVLTAFSKPFSIITGGAGTGKTTVINTIVNNCQLLNIPYAIVAPTGKAAARAKEATKGSITATIHRMMARPETANFRMLIIDEASMVTLDLFYEFILRFPHIYRIVFVGDKNQLEPIGWGSLFSNLIRSGKIPITELTVNHRSTLVGSDGINGILENAVEISLVMDLRTKGEIKGAVEPLEFIVSENFQIYENTKDLETLVKFMRDEGVAQRDFVILCPYKRLLKYANDLVQNIYSQGKKLVQGKDYHLDKYRTKWMLGDRVMMKVNNYSINVMNGEDGEITEIVGKGTDEDPNGIVVSWTNGSKHTFLMKPTGLDESVPGNDPLSEYDDIKETYDSENDQLTIRLLCHASGLTVHRAQGSEWLYGIVYLPPPSFGEGGSNGFINANMVYTMVTRARYGMNLIGDISRLATGAVTPAPWRCEKLAERLDPDLPKKMFAKSKALDREIAAAEDGYYSDPDWD